MVPGQPNEIHPHFDPSATLKIMSFTLRYVAVLLLCLGSLAAAPMGILVPAYFYPGPLWVKLNEAAAMVPVTAVMNPNNGPGTAMISDYQGAVAALTGAGGQVVGYVHTRVSPSLLTLRPLDDVKTDVDRYVAWYGGQGLAGIFVDEMRSDPGFSAEAAFPGKTVREYYQALYLHVTSKGPQYRVIANPGVSGGGIEAYLQSPRAADTMVTFERQDGYEAAAPSVWTGNYPASNFAHIPYNIPSADTMDYYVRLARSRNVGYIYVTNDYFTTYPTETVVNPWDTLPPYWEQQVQLVKSINNDTVPTRLFVTKVPNQAASLFVSGVPAVYYLVEASGNLKAWTEVYGTYEPSGSFSWTDPGSMSLERRFYRITTSPIRVPVEPPG